MYEVIKHIYILLYVALLYSKIFLRIFLRTVPAHCPRNSPKGQVERFLKVEKDPPPEVHRV